MYAGWLGLGQESVDAKGREERRHVSPRLQSGRLAAMAKMKPMKAAAEQSLVQLAGKRATGGDGVWGLVSGAACGGVEARRYSGGDAAGDSDAGGLMKDGGVVCDEGSVSASRDSAVGGLVRWRDGAVQVSRVEI